MDTMNLEVASQPCSLNIAIGHQLSKAANLQIPVHQSGLIRQELLLFSAAQTQYFEAPIPTPSPSHSQTEGELPLREHTKDRLAREIAPEFGTEQGSRQDTGDADGAENVQALEPARKPAERRCFNSFCVGAPASKYVRSRDNDRQLGFCRPCHLSYSSNQFCRHCDQVYFSDRLPDGLDWIKCRECPRKCHLHCAKKLHRSYIDPNRYTCIACENKRTKRQNRLRPEYCAETFAARPHPVARQSVRPEDRFTLFRETKETFNLLDALLLSQGYAMSAKEEALQDDFVRLREALVAKPDDQEILPSRKKRKV